MKKERLRIQQSRAFEIIKVALSKRVWSYLGHWRQVNVDYQDSLKTTVLGKIVKCYMEKMRVAFYRWRFLHSKDKTIERRGIISSMQKDQLDLQNEVIVMNNNNNEKTEELDYQRQRHLLKCVEGFEKRFTHIAVGRWRD